jgi:hypothetical protein
MDEFTKAYIECALWSSTNEDDEPLDRDYSTDDISPDCLASMVSDCKSFQEDNSELLSKWYDTTGETPELAGHDFWLTRNGHGAGFWDRWADSTPQGKIGRKLTAESKPYGSCDLYVGDDGKIHTN